MNLRLEPGITFTIPPGYRSSRARSTLFYKPYLGLMTRERDTAARIDSIHKRFVKARYLFHWRTTVIPLPYFCVRDNIEFSAPPPLSYYFLIRSARSSLPYPLIYALEIRKESLEIEKRTRNIGP